MAMIRVHFDWIEYVVFGLMLAVSLFIGVFFGFIKKEGQDTVDGYLLGGKKMTLFPVAMSLIASFISGIALLGIPAEIYTYGMNYSLILLSYPTSGLVCSYIFLPVFFKLDQVSVYQYMELRFNTFVRKMVSFLFTISQIGLVPIVMYGPALALSQVSDFGVFTIAFFLSAFCLFYTTIGGLKAVVWTDTIQGLVMYAAILIIATLGTIKVGGVSEVFAGGYRGGRFDFIWDFDPRIRASVWSLSLGLMITNTATSAIHPSFVQRFISLRTLREARWSVLIFMSGCFLFAMLNMYMGLIVYKYFEKCDPLATGVIDKPDQVLSHFIIYVFKDIRGLAGVFLAGIVSAALSTMSALLNTLSATVYEDFIEPIFGKKSDAKAAKILKFIVIAFGLLCYLLVLVMEKLGSLIELYNAFAGPCAGVILGIFFLGVFIPQVNSKGATIGGLLSLAAMCVMVYGSRMAIANGDLVYPKLPVSVEECAYNFTLVSNSTFSPTPVMGKVNPIFEITIYYYAVVGCILAMVFGGIVSYLTGPNKLEQVDRNLLSPIILRFLPNYTPVPIKETEMDENGFNNSCVMKEEKIDEIDCIVPEVLIKEEEGQVFSYVPMIGVTKEEKVLSYCGLQDFLEKRRKINHNGLNVKRNMNPKELLNANYNSYGTVSSSNMENHILERPNKCPHCDYKTITSTRLKRHMACHTGEKPHQCPHCDFKTLRGNSLKIHIMSQHTGEKPFHCPHCEFRTVDPSNLKKHVTARHMNEKAQQCPHCSYKTSRVNALNIHIMSQHTGEKPYRCPHCEYRTVDPSNLKKHVMNRHIGEKPQQCPYCEYKTLRPNVLNIHVMARHTGEKPYQCSHCEFRTVDPSNLRKHIIARHIGVKSHTIFNGLCNTTT